MAPPQRGDAYEDWSFLGTNASESAAGPARSVKTVPPWGQVGLGQGQGQTPAHPPHGHASLLSSPSLHLAPVNCYCAPQVVASINA